MIKKLVQRSTSQEKWKTFICLLQNRSISKENFLKNQKTSCVLLVNNLITGPLHVTKAALPERNHLVSEMTDDSTMYVWLSDRFVL